MQRQNGYATIMDDNNPTPLPKEAIQAWRDGLTQYLVAGMRRGVPVDYMVMCLEMEKMSLFVARSEHERKVLDQKNISGQNN